MRVKSTVLEKGVGRRACGVSCLSGRFLQTMVRNSVFVLEPKWENVSAEEAVG